MHIGRNPNDIVADMLNGNIIVSKCEPQSYFYIYFLTFTLEKGMNPYYRSNCTNSILI